jgi:hypothetical protein
MVESGSDIVGLADMVEPGGGGRGGGLTVEGRAWLSQSIKVWGG